MKSKQMMMGMALVAGTTFGAFAAADARVIHSDIAAIYQPDTRAGAEADGKRSESVSLLDGVVRTWQDPSRKVPAATPASDEATASLPRGKAKRSDTLAEESLRGVFNAYSSN